MARTIAGELTLPDGSPLANAAIHFTAKRTEAVRILEDVSSFFTTSSTGAYSQDVEPGYYAVSVSYAAVPGTQPRRWHLGDVWVEDGDPISLTALLALNNSAADPTDSALRQLLADAQAARDEAQAAAQEAEQYRDETASMLDSKIDESEKGEPGGVATLDSGGRVPAGQLPSYVDDVEEYADYAALPTPGEAGKIYITIDNNRQYRWGGSGYIELVASPGTTDNVPEGSSNLYHTASRVRAVTLAGISFVSSAAITASDTILSAFGKIQAKLNTLKGMAFLDKATQAQAEEGVSDNVGMTPARTRNAYTQWGVGVVNPPTLTMDSAWGNRVFRVDGGDPSNPLDGALAGINLNITGHDWGGQILLDHNLSQGTLMYRPKSGGVFGPIRTVWDSINLPQSSINNWNTAYGWGDYRQFGIGVPEGQSPAEVADVDAAKTSGNFRLPGNASGDHPFPGVSSSLRLEKASSSFITQWATRGGSDSSFSNTRAKIRRFNGTEWLPWAEVWTSANLPNIQSATPENGGLLVNNQKTGTGLERVLTESDLDGGGGGAGDSYESVAAFIASTPSSSAVNIISYYGGWSGTVEGPKGGFAAHKTGYTADSPSVGDPVAPSTIGTGDQAGLFWTADGAEWTISTKDCDVFMFGARGDGVTDDTAAFAGGAAFADSLYVPETPAAYMVQFGSVRVSKSGFRMHGDGARSYIKQIPGTISKTGGTLEVFGTEAARLTGIILQDFCLDFDKVNMTMAISPRDVEVLNLKYCTDFVVSNVKTLNGIGEGIDLDGCLDGLVFKSHSENNNGWGIHVSGGSKRNKIIGNTVLNNGHVEFRGGIDQYDGTETVEPASDNIYIGNYAEGNYRNYGIVGSGATFWGNKSIGGTTADLLRGIGNNDSSALASDNTRASIFWKNLGSGTELSRILELKNADDNPRIRLCFRESDEALVIADRFDNPLLEVAAGGPVSFVPEFEPETGSFGSVTYSEQNGSALKVGRAVTFRFSISTSAVTIGGAGGALRVKTNLPYLPSATTAVTVSSPSRWGSDVSWHHVTARLSANGLLDIEVGNPNTHRALAQVADMRLSGLDFSNQLYVSGTFFVA